jgi:DNA-binding response OmpR family regulator
MVIKKVIFVVDDEPDVTKSVKWALEYYNPSEYDVTCIKSGKECLELLEDKQIPNLILLDIMMPGMSGWMLSDRLRGNSSWKKIPIVFLTARRDEFAESTGRKIAKDYIKKPFDIHDLRKRIKEVLN